LQYTKPRQMRLPLFKKRAERTEPIMPYSIRRPP
jgi:hypothetical protein